MTKGDGYSGRQFDRVYPAPVGRIVRAWGVSQKRLREQRAAIVQELADHGQEDVLLAFKDGRLKWADLLRAKRQNRIASANLAVDLALHRPLWDSAKGRAPVPGAVTQTLEKMGCSDPTRARYGIAFQNLRDAAGDFLPDTAAVTALAQLTADQWGTIWGEMATLSAASRNRVRSAVSRFLSVFLQDKYHPTRRAVMQRMGAFEEEGSATPRTITLEEFWALMAALPDDTRAVCEPCYVTLAATGMRVGEYLQCRAEDIRRFPTIHIPGGKTGEDEVQVAAALEAIVRAAIPCTVGPAPKAWAAGREDYPGVQYDRRYHVLYDAMKAAAEKTGIPCSPHYLRHLFGALAVEGTNQIYAQHALRHKTPGMTAHYAKQKTNRQVGEAVGKALAAGQPKPVKSTGRRTGRRAKSTPTNPNEHEGAHYERE